MYLWRASGQRGGAAQYLPTLSPAGTVILEAAKKARLPWLRSDDSGW